MVKIKLVIFDVGGTLTDFRKLLDKTSEKILRRFYGIKPASNEIRKIIDGIDLTLDIVPVSQSVYKRKNLGYSMIFTKALLKHFDIPETEVHRFEDEWEKNIKWEKMKLFPDAIPTLQKLKVKYFLATIANVRDSVLHHKLLKKLKLKGHFHLHIDSDSFGLRKPHPKIFNHAINHFKVRPSEIVMVGDTPVADIIGAKKLGIHAVLINRRKLPYKFTPKTKPDYEITSLIQLPTILRKINNDSMN